jgi:hypothetical protein
VTDSGYTSIGSQSRGSAGLAVGPRARLSSLRMSEPRRLAIILAGAVTVVGISVKRAARVAGSGIGLFVAHRLVESIGGTIWARPRDDLPGAEFGFRLQPVIDDAG